MPELSDRLLSERMKELEARGLVRRTELDGGVQYPLTDMGRELDQPCASCALGPALAGLRDPSGSII